MPEELWLDIIAYTWIGCVGINYAMHNSSQETALVAQLGEEGRELTYDVMRSERQEQTQQLAHPTQPNNVS